MLSMPSTTSSRTATPSRGKRCRRFSRGRARLFGISSRSPLLGISEFVWVAQCLRDRNLQTYRFGIKMLSAGIKNRGMAENHPLWSFCCGLTLVVLSPQMWSDGGLRVACVIPICDEDRALWSPLITLQDLKSGLSSGSNLHWWSLLHCLPSIQSRRDTKYIDIRSLVTKGGT